MKNLVQQYLKNQKEYSDLWWSTKKELDDSIVRKHKKDQEDLIKKMSRDDLKELINLTDNKQAQIYYSKQIILNNTGTTHSGGYNTTYRSVDKDQTIKLVAQQKNAPKYNLN